MMCLQAKLFFALFWMFVGAIVFTMMRVLIDSAKSYQIRGESDTMSITKKLFFAYTEALDIFVSEVKEFIKERKRIFRNGG